MDQSRKITEGAVMVALFAILMAATVYIPVLGILFVWVLPIPLLLYTVRFGPKPGALVLAVSFVATFLIASAFSIPLVLLFGVGGYVVGVSYHVKRSAFRTLFAGSLSYIFTLVLLFVGSVVLLDIHPFEALQSGMEDSVDSTEQMLTSFDQEVDEEQLDFYRESIAQIPQIAPLIMIVTGVGYAFLTQTIAHPFLRRLIGGTYRFPPLREWSLPRVFLWYYLAGIIMRLAVIEDQGTTMHMLISNIFPLLEFAMIIQGASVMFQFVYMRNITRALPILILFPGLMLPLVQVFVRILGILDIGMDIKNRIKSDK
ncbi:YybS family protein [Salicibibacter cibi]|uniref:YybS family protein n=1 Tax=Salicibibacter cibi TaxID=2743001 RepID=A0A7T7CH10_9BACI|nr:YybS family protein [Salicibibacter cibi]QQK81768.1 YybS family protein [Salicibibacter cibi]